jgi:hypothetical protein
MKPRAGSLIQVKILVIVRIGKECVLASKEQKFVVKKTALLVAAKLRGIKGSEKNVVHIVGSTEIKREVYILPTVAADTQNRSRRTYAAGDSKLNIYYGSPRQSAQMGNVLVACKLAYLNVAGRICVKI